MAQPRPTRTRLKLIEVGEEVGVILPDEILARLGVVEGDELVFSDAPDGVLVNRRDGVAEQMEVAREVMDRRRDALRDLSE